MRLLIVIPLLLSLFACQTAPVKVLDNIDRLTLNNSEYPNHVTVYVLRSTSMAGALNPDRVFVDDVALGSIRRGRYIKLSITPGVHVVKIRNGYPMIGGVGKIEFQADYSMNKTYFFLVDHDASASGGGIMKFTDYIQQLSDADAQALLETYKPGTIYKQTDTDNEGSEL